LALGPRDVHVWRASLDLAEHQIHHLRRALTPDELETAGRFRFQRDRRRYVVAHGVLRDILSRYLAAEPRQLRFRFGPHGKPALTGAFGADGLAFNLTHSRELALCAVARGRDIGIDLEFAQADLSHERIAEQFFSPPEIEEFRTLPQEVRIEAFFNCWTRKEAYLKAKGDGLMAPLDQFSVSLIPGEPARLTSTPEADEWSLVALSPEPGYIGALAVEGHGWQLQCWRWPLDL
jgi:4'-phosphopantetheinyl transferase